MKVYTNYTDLKLDKQGVILLNILRTKVISYRELTSNARPLMKKFLERGFVSQVSIGRNNISYKITDMGLALFEKFKCQLNVVLSKNHRPTDIFKK